MRIKSIASSSLGNILEWYDFGLFTIYSSLLSELFFPNKDHATALLTTFGIFAVGFLCRPLGALIFGYLGDRSGRVKALRLSILMISIPTLLIGCLPTYQQAGIIAPILLTLIRIWQGISLGGEYSGNLIYLAESAPINYRATITSFAGTGANFGILLATVVGGLTSYLFEDHIFKTWAWRLPYMISGIISLIIYATRLQMQETHVFEDLKKKHLLAANPIKVMVRDNIPHVLRTLGLVCMSGTYYYFCFVYVPMFLMQRHEFHIFKNADFIGIFMALMLILVPLAGRICDYVGRRKMLLFNSISVAIVVVPFYSILQQNNFSAIWIVMVLFTILSSLEQGTTSIAVVENYPVPARYVGLSFGYNIGNGIFGGTLPLICEWLLIKTNNQLAPAMYICVCAIITASVAFFFTKETKHTSLEKS